MTSLRLIHCVVACYPRLHEHEGSKFISPSQWSVLPPEDLWFGPALQSRLLQLRPGGALLRGFPHGVLHRGDEKQECPNPPPKARWRSSSRLSYIIGGCHMNQPMKLWFLCLQKLIFLSLSLSLPLLLLLLLPLLRSPGQCGGALPWRSATRHHVGPHQHQLWEDTRGAAVCQGATWDTKTKGINFSKQVKCSVIHSIYEVVR